MKKSGFKRIKLNPFDIIFSQFIRKSRGYKCERCDAQHDKNSRGLHCAHFHSRRKRSVRYDEDNVACLCMGCHSYLDGHPMEKIEWFKKKLGEQEFEKLNYRANLMDRIDEDKLMEYYKKKLKELE